MQAQAVAIVRRPVARGPPLANGEVMIATRESSAERASVLIVEDEQGIRDILVELFEVPGTTVRAAGTVGEAQTALAGRCYDLIVTDLRLAGRRDGGLQVTAAAGLLSPDARVIVLTAFPDADHERAAHRLGAQHFLEKPVDIGIIADLAARYGVPTALGARPEAA